MRAVRGSIEVIPVIVLSISSVILANAGTPLMWSGIFRLFPINCLIGLGEGLFIWLVFRTGFFRTIGILLLANYASWIVGDVALLPFLAKAGTGFLGEQSLYHVWEFMWYVLAAAFGMSVVLEWPFCFWAMKQKRYRIIKAVVAVIAVNLVSYTFLVKFYMGMSTATVLTKLTQDPTLSFAANPKACVYFIAPDDGGLCRIRVDGTERKTILNISEMNKMGFETPQEMWFRTTVPFIPLYVQRSLQEEYLDLWCNPNDNGICLLKSFAKQTPFQQANPSCLELNYQHITIPSGDLEDAMYLVLSDWHIETGYWSIEGLLARSGRLEKQFSLELPFLTWYSRYPTLVTKDQVVYQLGDQIVLLDLEKEIIGVIARGYSPVVILDEGTENTEIAEEPKR